MINKIPNILCCWLSDVFNGAFMMRFFLCLFAILVSLFGKVHAQDRDQIWSKTLEAMNYASIARASFAKGCVGDNDLSKTQAYLIICPKLKVVPSSVINSAALPYMRKHVSELHAKEAIKHYTSPEGIILQRKILREIETGVYDQLTKGELWQMDIVNKLPFSQALKRFGADREQNLAVARAMLLYEP